MFYLVIAATLAILLFIALFDWITTNFEYPYYRRLKPAKYETPEQARITSTMARLETHHNPFAILLAYIGLFSVIGLFMLFGEGLRKILSESIVVCDDWVSWLIYAVVGVFAAFFYKWGKESTRIERESLKEKIAEMQEGELWNNVEASCEELIKTVDEVLASRSEGDK